MHDIKRNVIFGFFVPLLVNVLTYLPWMTLTLVLAFSIADGNGVFPV